MRPRLLRKPPACALLDALLALSLTGLALYEIWVAPVLDDGLPGPRWPNTALMLLVTVPLGFRRWAPTVVFGLVLSAVALHIQLIDSAHSLQPPVQDWIALLVVFYSLGAHATRLLAIVAGAIGGAFVVGGDVADLLLGGTTLEETVPAWFMLSAAYGIGFALRGQRVESTLLARRAERLEREREQNARIAVAEERVRIGRELHDIVAHAISVIVVQSQAAQRVLDEDPPSAHEALGAIETTGRQALVEMRRLLGVLRKEDDVPVLAPSPSLAHLEDLAAHLREAGLPVELQVDGEPKPLAPGVDLSAYRIVQEALTNTLQHAGPARAHVIVRYRVDRIELEISDDGRGVRGYRAGGHGLVGMRERAALVGGDVVAETIGGRGYTVRARLPA